MKLRSLDWLLLVIKAIVSALLFVVMGIGWLLIIDQTWTESNWIQEVGKFWSEQPVSITIMIIVLIGCWVVLQRVFYEQALLSHLATDVSALKDRVHDTKSSGIDIKKFGKTYQPLTKAVNEVFDSAQQVMIEEHELERSKDEMITNVSHDLRTPLTSIIGYLGLIVADEDKKILPEDADKYVNTAYTKAGQMKSLVEDLFDYTQVHQVDFQLRWGPLDIAAMLQQLAVTYELEAKEKDIIISAVTNPNTIEMMGDADRLARVFMNLINNALKYGNDATFIRLSARAYPVRNEVEIQVTNNGERIPEEALERLFERFYRVESSRNIKTGGTGLGLAIVNSVVTAHGGSVRVESNDDLTSFVVTLPLQITEG